MRSASSTLSVTVMANYRTTGNIRDDRLGQNSMVTPPPVDGFLAGESIIHDSVYRASQSLALPASIVYDPIGTSIGILTTTSSSTYIQNGISGISSFSAWAVPAAPGLSSPTNGAGNQATSLTFSWSTSSYASSYSLQISTVANFASTISNQIGLATTTASVNSGISYGGITYYWRVSAGQWALHHLVERLEFHNGRRERSHGSYPLFADEQCREPADIPDPELDKCEL